VNTSNDDTRERRRLEIQAALDSRKSQSERNRLGQFATPPGLAADLICLAKSMLPKGGQIRFFDPAFGTGAFYSALLRYFSVSRIDWARGFEIDPHYGEPSLWLWSGTPLSLTLADFTRTVPPDNDMDKATLLVCNPPYVRHHHLDAALKRRLKEASHEAGGVDLNGLSGLYCHFVSLSHAWMARDGLAIWLVPSEFMDVNYGRAIKEYLLRRVTLLRAHRFDPAESQFSDALVSSAVVIFRNSLPPAGHRVEFTYGGTLAAPAHVRLVPLGGARPEAKWSRLAHISHEGSDIGSQMKLGDFFRIKRGIATGANEFFIMREVAAEERGLPAQFLKPILPSPRFLDEEVIEGDERGWPCVESRLALLDCPLPEEEVRLKYPAMWKYIKAGREQGIHTGYICAHRYPWYSQEERQPAPILCTYMGRAGEGRGAFRFILNHSKAIAANVYLMLYPRPTLMRSLRDHPGGLRAIWNALKDIPWDTLLTAGRVYGGGLHKIEPKELAAAPVDLPGFLPRVSPMRGRQLAIAW
jgi:adenine-specific DNA-methyltransferase